MHLMCCKFNNLNYNNDAALPHTSKFENRSIPFHKVEHITQYLVYNYF
jgi:hypothetical protein